MSCMDETAARRLQAAEEVVDADRAQAEAQRVKPHPLTHDDVRAIVREEALQLLTLELRNLTLKLGDLLPELLESGLEQLQSIDQRGDVHDGDVSTNGLISRLLVHHRHGIYDRLRKGGLLNAGDLDLSAYLVRSDELLKARDGADLFSGPTVGLKAAGDGQAARDISHDASPSVAGCGDHTVGDGPVAGAGIDAPATKVTGARVHPVGPGMVAVLGSQIAGWPALILLPDDEVLDLVDELISAVNP